MNFRKIMIRRCRENFIENTINLLTQKELKNKENKNHLLNLWKKEKQIK